MPWTDQPLITERFRLRPASEADKAAIARGMASQDQRRYLGGPVSKEHIDAFLCSVVGERRGSFVIADLTTNAYVGAVSFARDRGELEVSYEVMPARWRQGVAAEAVAAAIDWAWEAFDDPSLIAVTQSANVASIALLQRLGFVLETEFVEFDAPQSQFRLLR